MTDLTSCDYSARDSHSIIEADVPIEIAVGKAGIAAEKPVTVSDVFKKCGTGPLKDTVALVTADGRSITWASYYASCQNAAKAMIALGLKAFSTVAIIGFNAEEWFYANNGAILAGAKASGIYTTNDTDACQYVVEHSSAQLVVVENQMQLNKFKSVAKDFKNVKAFIVYSETAAETELSGIPVYDWASFIAKGEGDEYAFEMENRIKAIKPGHAQGLIYTSGTTGKPKAVMMSHDNATWTTKMVASHIPAFWKAKEHHLVSYLPLSHVAATMVDIHLPMMFVAGGIPTTVHFADANALKGTLKATLQKARPTIFLSVPRVWEKFADAIRALGKSAVGLKKKISAWAKGQLLMKHTAGQVGSDSGRSFGNKMFAGLADKLVGGKVRPALGLDRCMAFYSAAAPISADTLFYLGSIGVPVIELYGMSESSGPQTSCISTNYAIGSVGTTMPGAETMLDHQEGRDKEGEGEICFRGRHIMMGYLNNKEKTDETIDPEGWLHSGDVGSVDKFGMLRITGRIKELLITAGGENIAPVLAEDFIKGILPGLSNVMMVGDRKKYLCCLVTLKQIENLETGNCEEALVGDALAIDEAVTTVEQAINSEKWTKYITDGITRYNNESAISSAAKIQKFRIVSNGFTVNNGALTPTMKLKRGAVVGQYNDLVESMY